MTQIVTKDVKTGSMVVSVLNYPVPKFRMGDKLTVLNNTTKTTRQYVVTEIHMGVEYNKYNVIEADIFYISEDDTMFNEDQVVDLVGG